MAPGNPKILSLDPGRSAPRVIDEVVAALSRGELVVIPTETVYGVAADPRVPGAVERIYLAKSRSARKPITLMAADVSQVRDRGVDVPPAAARLAARYWPGPLTLVLKEGRKSGVAEIRPPMEEMEGRALRDRKHVASRELRPPEGKMEGRAPARPEACGVAGASPSTVEDGLLEGRAPRDRFIGFRVPDHPVTQAVLRAAGSLLAVTSANRSGDDAAVTAQDAAAALGDRVSLILDAGRSPGGVASTVVKVDGEQVEVLREGAIPKMEILKVAGVA